MSTIDQKIQARRLRDRERRKHRPNKLALALLAYVIVDGVDKRRAKKILEGVK